jgi:hypothetical protein
MTITETIKTVLKDYMNPSNRMGWINGKFMAKTAKAINHGQCEDFADFVISDFPKAKKIWSQEIEWKMFHCMIFYKGKYYDSECPEGTKNWKNLPVFRGIKKDKLVRDKIGK